MKRGYYIHQIGAEWGVAVVAATANEAKRIGFKAVNGFEDCAWINLRCHWMRHAAVSDLPIGMVQDERDALIRGLYGSLMEYPCDECGKDADVTCWHGRALCDCCIEDARRER